MGVEERNKISELNLPPGFRFYPTDEELMVQYLCRKIVGYHFELQIIAEIDLYKFDPWELPSKALFGEKEWYFFSPRDRKYPNGSRPNRVAGSGYWKATGTDKVITTQGKKVGIKKALVFYVGKAPKGVKTNWIMHEYRLTEPTGKSGSSKLDDWVLCRIYEKKSSVEKSTSSKEQSTVVSSSSSSSHLEDVFGVPRTNTFKINVDNSHANEDDKFTLQRGLSSIDWATLAGLSSVPEFGFTQSTQSQSGQVKANNNDISETYVPVLPPVSHSQGESSMDNKVDEEVQSGIRTRRLNNHSSDHFSQNSNVSSQNYANSADPFGIRYPAQSTGFGYGYKQ